MDSNAVTICFIDDIRSVVEGLSKEIRWEDHGISVCGTALNGADGLAMVESARPDIIVTDIRMPKLDGLELIKRVREMLPRSKVIFMTGFSDFEYAKQAVELGAFGFITKPFSLANIEEVVLKAKAEVECSRNQELHVAELERQVQASMPLLRQEFFKFLLHHKANPSEITSRWEYLKPDLEPNQLLVMVVEIDRFADFCRDVPMKDMELARFALLNITEETIAMFTKGLVFRETGSRLVAVMNMPSDESVVAVAEACCHNASMYTRLTVSIGLGRTVGTIHELSASYSQAVHALSYHFYTGGNAVISYDDVADARIPVPGGLYDRGLNIVYSLQSGNINHTLKTLDQILEDYMNTEQLPDPEYFISLYYELAYMMLRAVQEKVPMTDLADLHAFVREGRSSSEKSIEHMKRNLRHIAAEGCRYIESQNRSAAGNIIKTAVDYVKTHLDQDISVRVCAHIVHLSPSYFASLFKKVTGVTFNQFVTQERMTEAKRLLLEDRPIQEIAERLGYVERRYFSDVFKKHTRMTPSEFKQAYLSKNLSL